MDTGDIEQVPSKNYLIRQAETLLRFARQTRDPSFAAVLIEKAADLIEKFDELSLPKKDLGPQPPDVDTI